MIKHYKNKQGKLYKKTCNYWWVDRGDGVYKQLISKPTEQLTPLKTPCYVFDLDGTLFDNSAREHLVPDDPTKTANWQEWSEHCHLDTVIVHTANIARSLSNTFEIKYVTSRCEDCLIKTQDMLLRSGLPIGQIHMREVGDDRSCAEYKLSQFNEISKTHDILSAFEDKECVVMMLSSHGFNMIKV